MNQQDQQPPVVFLPLQLEKADSTLPASISPSPAPSPSPSPSPTSPSAMQPPTTQTSAPAEPAAIAAIAAPEPAPSLTRAQSPLNSTFQHQIEADFYHNIVQKVVESDPPIVQALTILRAMLEIKQPPPSKHSVNQVLERVKLLFSSNRNLWKTDLDQSNHEETAEFLDQNVKAYINSELNCEAFERREETDETGISANEMTLGNGRLGGIEENTQLPPTPPFTPESEIASNGNIFCTAKTEPGLRYQLGLAGTGS